MGKVVIAWGFVAWCMWGWGTWQWRVGVSLGKGEGDEGAEPGFTPRLRAAVDVGQAAGLMRSFINMKKDSPSLSRVTSGNSGFPRLVPVTSGSFSRSL